jgi:DNA-directed RNA polymerase sigma subunit (sigma70/sigma32)
MSVREDDTELDALAAQVRASPRLSTQAVEVLIAAAVGGDRDAHAALVEHALGPVLAEAIARRDRGVELLDLFQEGSLAALVAVEEYVERTGHGAGFVAYIRRVVNRHLDHVLEENEAAVAEAAELVEDTRLLDVARVALHRQAGREPTVTELASVLLWSPERVELISGILGNARSDFDSDIVQYLDDAGDDGADGWGGAEEEE